MKVLVTGSAGYIGSVLVPVLKAAGHKVLGYDVGWFGDDQYAEWHIRGDIRNPLVQPGWPDVVVHLAGLSNDPMGDLSPALTYEINRWATIDLIDHHRTARHVVISSCAVYGQAEDICDEESIPNPQTVYARCKASVDEWVMTEPGVEAIALRLGTVFGESPNHRLDLVVNRMVFDALNEREVRVTGDAARPLVHIRDVADAVRWAVEGTTTGIFNVIGENVRMKELGREVAAVAAVPVRYSSGGPDTRDYKASGAKLLRAGWSPTRTVAGSLASLYLFTEDFDHYDLDQHVRIEQLRRRIAAGTLDPQHLRSIAA